MQPGILYYPSDLCFPTADFISVDFQKHKTNQVFCIQVTSAESYIKMILVHKNSTSSLKWIRNLMKYLSILLLS